jgi:hypothetical protein
MKKIYLTILVLYSSFAFAQELTTQDALRYAIEDMNGTARFRGMSGAFGALGGDLSSIAINPAGSLFFNNNFASFTGTNNNKRTNSKYFGTNTKDNFSTLDVNQIGVVFVFNDTREESNWKKLSLALNYENTNNFDNSIFSAGLNPNNTISQYFLDFAQGVPLNILNNSNYGNLNFSDQQAFLGYQAFLFDPVDDSNPNNTSYTSNVPSGGNYYQEFIQTSNGFNGKVSANFASAYKNRIFIGMNLNIHFTDYIKSSTVYERNNNSPNLGVQEIAFNNEVYTFGRGFSFNLGAIAKVTEEFRVGLAYESPTWYRLNDELSQSISAYSTDGPDDFFDRFNPNVINIYPTYRLQTPGKWTGSAAYTFGNRGLISADITTKDYSSTKFRPVNEPLYRNLNTQMSQELGNAIELRIGGEYRIKQVSLRGGYRFEQSPYENSDYISDLTGFSLGAGYNFGESRLDLSFANSQRYFNQSLISSGMNDTARIKNTNNNITVTYSINF